MLDKHPIIIRTDKNEANDRYTKRFTLCADQYDRNLGGIPIVGHFIEVVGDRIIADLVVKAEHEDYSIHPGREL